MYWSYLVTVPSLRAEKSRKILHGGSWITNRFCFAHHYASQQSLSRKFFLSNEHIQVQTSCASVFLWIPRSFTRNKAFARFTPQPYRLMFCACVWVPFRFEIIGITSCESRNENNEFLSTLDPHRHRWDISMVNNPQVNATLKIPQLKFIEN